MFKNSNKRSLKKLSMYFLVSAMILVNCISVYAYAPEVTTNLGTYYLKAYSIAVNSGADYEYVSFGGFNDPYRSYSGGIVDDYSSPYLYVDSDLYKNGYLVDNVTGSTTNNTQYTLRKTITDTSPWASGAYKVYTYHRADCPNGSLAVYSSGTIY